MNCYIKNNAKMCATVEKLYKKQKKPTTSEPASKHKNAFFEEINRTSMHCQPVLITYADYWHQQRRS